MNEILNLIYENMQVFITLITMVVIWILGKAAKKSTYINNNLIIFQNIFIGLLVFGLYWLCTKDFSTAIALSGLFATAGYDLLHNIEKLIENKK